MYEISQYFFSLFLSFTSDLPIMAKNLILAISFGFKLNSNRDICFKNLYNDNFRNTGDKPQIFHSCSALRDDPQFTLHVANEKTAYLLQQARNHSVSGGNKRNRLPGLSLQELLQQDCLLAPGTAISPGEKHRVVVSLQAK